MSTIFCERGWCNRWCGGSGCRSLGSASAPSREELESTYRQLFERLASDAAKTLADPRFMRDFINHLSAPPNCEPPSGGEEN